MFGDAQHRQTGRVRAIERANGVCHRGNGRGATGKPVASPTHACRESARSGANMVFIWTSRRAADSVGRSAIFARKKSDAMERRACILRMPALAISAGATLANNGRNGLLLRCGRLNRDVDALRNLKSLRRHDGKVSVRAWLTDRLSGADPEDEPERTQGQDRIDRRSAKRGAALETQWPPPARDSTGSTTC